MLLSLARIDVFIPIIRLDHQRRRLRHPQRRMSSRRDRQLGSGAECQENFIPAETRLSHVEGEKRIESPFTKMSESNSAVVSLVETQHADCLALSRNCHAKTEVLAWCACFSPGSNVRQTIGPRLILHKMAERQVALMLIPLRGTWSLDADECDVSHWREIESIVGRDRRSHVPHETERVVPSDLVPKVAR